MALPSDATQFLHSSNNHRTVNLTAVQTDPLSCWISTVHCVVGCLVHHVDTTRYYQKDRLVVAKDIGQPGGFPQYIV